MDGEPAKLRLLPPFVEGDEIAVRILEHKPAHTPVRILRFDHNVVARGDELESFLYIVNVKMQCGLRAVHAGKDGIFAFLVALDKNYLDSAAGKRRATRAAPASPEN